MNKNKVVLISGANKGIGLACARRLGREQMIICGCGRDKSFLEHAQNELKNLGIRSWFTCCDVQDYNQCTHFIQGCLKRFGRIDVLINNAGLGFSGPIKDSDPKEAELMVRVNILGVYYLTKLTIPVMEKQRQGTIINIGSVAGIKYSPNFALYSATKFALRAFSEGLRGEVQDKNIRVILVNPGMTATDFYANFSKKGAPLPVDLDKMIEPAEIAESIYYVLSKPDKIAINELTIRPIWQER